MKTHITLHIERPQEKYLKVEYTFDLGKLDFLADLVLTFPAWTPGSYLVRDFAQHVEGFAAYNDKGGRLPFTKVGKNQWSIRRGSEKSVRVSHLVYANDLSVRAAYADHEMVFLNTPAAIFHPEGFVDSPVSLTVKIPKDWHLAMAPGPGNQTTREFPDFDFLYDSPVLAAKTMSSHHFQSGSVHYTLSHVGPCLPDFDFTKLCADVAKVCAKQTHLFGGNPCKKYLFQLLFIKNGYGGLEHRFSSTNIFDGSLVKDPKKYQELVALLAHEHFHLWNIKRIRPKALGPFDYHRENYTRELWIAEGLTSYYDDHTSFRAGVQTPQNYLDVVSDNINKLVKTKGYRLNSLSDASYDAWLKFYRPNENTPNRTISYYLKGGLVMMLLDLEIIRKTKGRHNLDHVMRELYRLYLKRPETGITREEFFAIVAALTKTTWDRFIADYIDGTTEIDWQKAFRGFGIDVSYQKPKTAFYHGLALKDRGGQIIIDRIAEDSAAFRSNLQPGDELIAVNGHRLDKADSFKKLADQKSLKLIFARRGQILEDSLQLDKNTRQEIRLEIKKNPGAAKKYLAFFLRR